jgi:hypothetical protein
MTISAWVVPELGVDGYEPFPVISLAARMRA